VVKPNLDNPNTDKPIMDKPDNNKNLDKAFEFNNNDFNNELSKVNNESINQSIKENEYERLIEDLNFIFEQGNLYLYGEKEQSFIKNTLRDMYLTENFCKSLNMPVSIVRDKLKLIQVNHIDNALNNLKNAVIRSQNEETKITAPIKYFAKCLWNIIIEDELNSSGIFDNLDT
jgi:hypothetical protein